jgi:hypothetical protein
MLMDRDVPLAEELGLIFASKSVDSQSFIPQGPEGFSHHLCVIGLMEV